jgi:hypothetical protein
VVGSEGLLLDGPEHGLLPGLTRGRERGWWLDSAYP